MAVGVSPRASGAVAYPPVGDTTAGGRLMVPGWSARGWVAWVLRFPLAGKLAGANALIVIVTLATAIALHGSAPADREMLAVLGLALAVSFLVNLALVTVALRPLRTLEVTAA